MHANDTGKQTLNFFQHMSEHIQWRWLYQITEDRTRTLNWHKKRKRCPKKIKCSWKYYIKKLWESEVLDCGTKFIIMASTQLKKPCCLVFQISMVKLSFIQKSKDINKNVHHTNQLGSELWVTNIKYAITYIILCHKCGKPQKGRAEASIHQNTWQLLK